MDLDLVARGASDLESLADELRDAHRVDVVARPADLGDSTQVSALIDGLDTLDIVINNAGAIPSGALDAVDEETWRAAWDLKVFGYINLCRLALPRLEEQGRGVILNIIGGAGARPNPGYIAGTAGNAALMAFTTALGGRSLRRGVRVLGINPGLIVTNRLEQLMRQSAEQRWGDPERWEEMLAGQKPPPGQPEQVAMVAAFLVSDRADHVSGTILPVDGGSSAR
ncbi:MAG: SDR family oxidoreductase [Acidimicrobiia bacterium]|nr:SDR family oxidoreductase [Acidimicrobiia bacterium]